MSKLKKVLFLLGIVFVAMIVGNLNKTHAATASISSNQTVTQGSTVTVTGSVTAGSWNMNLSGAGQNKGLVGQTSVASNQSASTSITFTASTIGEYTFNFSGDITDFDTDATTYPTKSCVIKVVAQNNDQTNQGGSTGNNSGGTTATNPPSTPTPTAMLTNLGIRPHDFSGFRSGTTSYTAKVPNDCTSVEIYATPAAGGKVSGTGTKTLKEGSNPFTITVTNGTASKSYSLNVIRETSGEDLDPNHPDDDENPEETEENPGIGLITFEIPGFTLDKEFATDVYEYTVKVEDDITVEFLEDIKSKIVATTGNENFVTEVTTAILSEEKGTITIVVKDAEREYAKYVITFEKEEEEKEETPVVALTNISNSNNSGNKGTFGLTFEFMIGLLIVGYGITLFFAVFFAIKCYLKDRELEEYAEHEFGEGNDIEGQDEINPLGELYSGLFTKDRPQEVDRTEEIFEEEQPEEEIKEVTSSLGKLAGYRNLRGTGKTTGRHF